MAILVSHTCHKVVVLRANHHLLGMCYDRGSPIRAWHSVRTILPSRFWVVAVAKRFTQSQISVVSWHPQRAWLMSSTTLGLQRLHFFLWEVLGRCWNRHWFVVGVRYNICHTKQASFLNRNGCQIMSQRLLGSGSHNVNQLHLATPMCFLPSLLFSIDLRWLEQVSKMWLPSLQQYYSVMAMLSSIFPTM